MKFHGMSNPEQKTTRSNRLPIFGHKKEGMYIRTISADIRYHRRIQQKLCN